MNDHYILNISGDPVPEPDVMKWALWFEEHNNDRRIARTELPDGVVVSTVFLGLDHSFGRGEPLLFETMIFGGPHDETQDRYATRQAAINGHAHYVALARGDEP
jgi:hypothetical protein